MAFSEYSPTLRSALSTTIFTLSADAMPSIVAPREDVCVDEKPEKVPEDLRRRLDEVFGDVLPDVTRDERDERRPSNDDALLDDRPPHHDRG